MIVNGPIFRGELFNSQSLDGLFDSLESRGSIFDARNRPV